MIMSDGLLRVFWPYDLPRSSAPGVIVGWRNSELDLFVLTVLEDVEVSFDLGFGTYTFAKLLADLLRAKS